jgi:DnaK suppressor protein
VDTERVAARLETWRDELAAELAALRQPLREPGAQLQYGKRAGDHTSDAVEQRTRALAAARLQHFAAEVARALEKLADGSYGRCDRCRWPIPAQRLVARPWATVCVAC